MKKVFVKALRSLGLSDSVVRFLTINQEKRRNKKMIKKLLGSLVLVLFAGKCIASIGVEVSPDSWNVGTGGSDNFTSPNFTVQNPGSESAKVNIRATNTQNWTLGTSTGLNTFVMQWGSGSSWNSITTVNSVVNSSLGASC